MSTPRPHVLLVIPARWGSSRFPGKPLHLIAGKPLVQHVWERCKQSKLADKVIIATDDSRIADAARTFNALACMTSSDHPSGTDRVAEAAKSYPESQIVINVQGDEPLISPQLIDELASAMIADVTLAMTTAAAPIEDDALLTDSNVVKVVRSLHGDALYFTRSLIPFPRAEAGVVPLRHLGIYAYRRAFLFDFVSWPPAPLERTESLEQLRALENGARIRVLLTSDNSPGVDTEAQARAIEPLLAH